MYNKEKSDCFILDSGVLLKVRQLQNEFMKSLCRRAEILKIFRSYFGRNDDFINSF